MADDVSALVARLEAFHEFLFTGRMMVDKDGRDVITEHMELLRDAIAALYAQAQALNTVRERLSHHLREVTDPCQDRGCEWPCDVAEALSAVSSSAPDPAS